MSRITMVEVPIVDPANKDAAAMLVIYTNNSNQHIYFKGIMDDAGRIETIDLHCHPKTKTAWIFRPLTMDPQFDSIVTDTIHRHSDGDFGSDGLIDTVLSPNINI